MEQRSDTPEAMSFFVDVVTEDSFYENLTLGVVKILEAVPYVNNVRIERRNGCEESAIVNWEQRHCCALPEDLRNFYASIDGFQLLWNLQIAGDLVVRLFGECIQEYLSGKKEPSFRRGVPGRSHGGRQPGEPEEILDPEGQDSGEAGILLEPR